MAEKQRIIKKIMGMDAAEWMAKISPKTKDLPLRWQPKIFVERFIEYLYWCEKNPIKKTKVLNDGTIVDYEAPRAPLKKGFEAYVGRPELIKATKNTKNYKSGPQAEEYQAVIGWIQNILFEQKFTGAAVGVYNASLISKELGLVERQEIEQNSVSNTTIEVIDNDTKAELDKLMDKGEE